MINTEIQVITKIILVRRLLTATVPTPGIFFQVLIFCSLPRSPLSRNSCLSPATSLSQVQPTSDMHQVRKSLAGDMSHCLLEKFFQLLRNLSAVISPRQSFPSSTEHLEFGSIDKDAPAALRLLQSFSLYQQSTKLFTIIIYIRPRLWGEISGHAGVVLQH